MHTKMRTANVERPARIWTPDFVDAPALSPAPLPQAGEGRKQADKKSRKVARDNACERSDALRARAADLR
ncbi:conserved hypothetical protein [Cupriavidus phytorum]|uniref:Uncharacterized protein n=1 Tax=Cupriavidus taiwanensis TaxID=164546 RepID=A0A375CMY0_9BURK|nr:conserved hypothetical protein [Cupriavidus taiwanensis]